MALIKCPECGKQISDTVKKCPNCGYRRKKKLDKNILKNLKSKKVIVIIIIFILVIAGCITVYKIKSNMDEKARIEEYNKRPIKLNISMTSYYGTIEYILYELDLDFDLVTNGANCFVGTQKNEFQTEKYGVLHTEYRYCKSNRSLTFRVYNDEKDQKLREPKAGELPEFDEYGKKVKNSNISDM